MKPPDNSPDAKYEPVDTRGWHLDIPPQALAGMTRTEALNAIRNMVNILEGDDRIPFNDWIDDNIPKDEPPEISEPGALVHKEIYPFRDGMSTSSPQGETDAQAARRAEARIIPLNQEPLKGLLDAVANASAYEIIDGEEVIVANPGRDRRSED